MVTPKFTTFASIMTGIDWCWEWFRFGYSVVTLCSFCPNQATIAISVFEGCIYFIFGL